MSRLPSLTPRELVAALKRGGFSEHHQTGSHLYLEHPTISHLVSVPMHRKDLKRPTMKAIIKQAGLSEEEFRTLL